MKAEIERINQLDECTIRLKNFINIMDSTKNIQRKTGWDIRGIIRMKKHFAFSIYGSRWFGVGTHKEEIIIPNEMVEDLKQMAINRLNAVEVELKSLVNSKEDVI